MINGSKQEENMNVEQQKPVRLDSSVDTSPPIRQPGRKSDSDVQTRIDKNCGVLTGLIRRAIRTTAKGTPKQVQNLNSWIVGRLSIAER